MDSLAKISNPSLIKSSSKDKLDFVSTYPSAHLLPKSSNIVRKKKFSTLTQSKKNGKDIILMRISHSQKEQIMGLEKPCFEMFENITSKLRLFPAAGPIQEWSAGSSNRL